jgi:hypothetical protein
VKDIDGIVYINCGDWVDSCTAIIEHMDGRIELLEWIGRPVPQLAHSVDPEEEDEADLTPVPATASMSMKP